MEKNIKILISCHKPSDYIQNDILQPIQVGCDLRDHLFDDMLHDNDGDNISTLNPRFCELTAQYYAWKNMDADYFGFFHYRRYLAFNENVEKKYDIWGNLNEDCVDEDAARKYGFDEQSIQHLVSHYDIILPELKDIRKMPNQGKNIREQYLGSGYLHEKDLDLMLSVIAEKYPKFLPYAEKYLDGTTTYLNNMFIMRKDIFRTYNKWLFDILFECNKRIDFTDYSVEAIRTPGHLAERLLNIFIIYVKDKKRVRFKELPTVAFIDTDPMPEYRPAYEENNVAIALSANDFYVPYVATLLTSIIDNSSVENNYDILIMNRDITQINQNRLKDIVKNHKNFSLRFINVNRYSSKFKHIFLRGHFSLETYFRLLMPDVLKKYHKVLYLDSDLVVVADLAELYNTDVEGKLLAACHDADTAGLYNGYEPQKKEYMDNVLRIRKPYEYFQAGVILFNLDEFRKTYTVTQMLQFANSNDWELLDQDVLNYLAQGHVQNVDMVWNVMTDWRGIRISDIISRAPKYLKDEYMKAHANPKIIHYAGPDKPWMQPYSDFAEVFWKYCRKTVFYEVAVQRMCSSEKQQDGIAETLQKSRLKAIDTLFPKNSERRVMLDNLYIKLHRK